MKKRPRRPASKSNPEKKRKSPFRSREAAGFILLLAAVLILLSLVSYDPKDSWSSTDPGRKIHNFTGKAGASLADILLQLLGLASFVLPAALFVSGIGHFMSADRRRWGRQILGFFVLVLIVGGLLTLLFPRVSYKGEPILRGGGGFSGHLVSSFLTRYFNHLGTLLLLTGFLILYILFSTRLSLKKMASALARFFSFSLKKVKIQVVHHQKAKSREKARKRVLEKWASLKSAEGAATENGGGTGALSGKKKGRKVKPAAPPKARETAPPPVEEKPLFPEVERRPGFQMPPFDLLDWGKQVEKIDKNELLQKKRLIEDRLKQFQVFGEVREYHPGPIITIYEFFPDPGIKVSKVANLSEEVSLALEAISVRIQRIPGKSSLGIEVPNNKREVIKIRDIIQSEKFKSSKSILTFALGKDVHGEVYTTDLSIMPHLLIAGATGTGKSVALSSLIASILYKATPEEVKLILIDPKRLEFSVFEDIPHLLCPVVKDPRKAEGILHDAIKKMEMRYKKMAILNVRNIQQYNQMMLRIRDERKGQLSEEEDEQLRPIPYIVIIIDELAELMMIGAKEIERGIGRLAQLARAVGIHLVMATQRPSTDVITGLIKNNFSCRISFRVPSKIDSRIILDSGGAEKLLGDGDMLFMPPNNPRLIRLHGSFISLPEINRLVKFVKEQGEPEYDERIIRVLKSPVGQEEEEDTSEKDPIFVEAVELILDTGQASASYLQRKLKLGYARAARVIDQMEQEGIVGPPEGSKPREILVDPKTYLQELKKRRG